MKRKLIDELAAWRTAKHRKPLFLFGARGCGKTFLALEFARSFYEGALYLNFEQHSEKRNRFLHFFEESFHWGLSGIAVDSNSSDLNAADLNSGFTAFLSAVFEIPREYLPNFLVILDEVAAADGLLERFSSVWKEELPFSVMLLSSRALPKEIQTPDYELHRLFPLQFDEFLCAVGSEWYAEVIQGHYQTKHKVPGIVHNELLEHFEDYLLTGGMPAAVNEYLASKSSDNVFEIHQSIFGKILLDISRYYEEGLALRMRQVLSVVPEQLAKPNPKFQYRMLRKGATSSMYEPAINRLTADSVLLSCHSLSDKASFRLFPADVGIYAGMECCVLGFGNTREASADTGQSVQYNVRNSIYFNSSARKAALECYVIQALAARGYQPFFWTSGTHAKIDFVIKKEESDIPVEIKTEERSRSKSLGIYRQENEIAYSVKISSKNFDFTGFSKQIPYYAVFCL